MSDQYSKKFIEALTAGDRVFMKKVPKADVHNHATLGGDFQTWVRNEGLDLEEGPHHFPDFTDFQNLVDKIFTFPYDPISDNQQIQRLMSLYRATFEAALDDSILYMEPGFDAPWLNQYKGDVEAMTGDIRTLIDLYGEKIRIEPDIGIIRVFEQKEIERTIYPCIESGFFSGLDIFADERFGEPEKMVPIFRAAKKAGMKLKAHAGELLDADFVRRSVEVLELDEVQHGISAAQSPEVMRFLAENQIRLNICPSSNIQLCQTENFKTHPLRILMDYGVKCSVNSDDIIIFGRSCSEEFFSLYETGLYTPEELDQLRMNGFPG